MIEKSILEKSQGAIKPSEIGSWTLAEIAAFLEDPQGLGHAGPKMTEGEIQERLAKRAEWSNLQKLRNYEW